MNPYSYDLRLRAVMAYERREGSLAEIARRYEVCENTLSDWCRRYRKTGSIVPLPHSGGSRAILSEEEREHIRRFALNHNDATLEAIRDNLAAQRHVLIGTSTISNVLQEDGITRKKDVPSRRTPNPGMGNETRSVRKRNSRHTARRPRISR